MNMKNENNKTILIHCQYVYGIGHLVRAVKLAHGLSSFFNVYMLSGGERVPNFYVPKSINFIQLPAIYKKESANYLSPVDSSLSIEECFKLRENAISQLVHAIQPDYLITEHFPFGLLFEKEVLKLIEFVKRSNLKSKIISSLRDVIESSKGGVNDSYICKILNKYYDLVLVHGDPNIIPFSSSFPKEKEIEISIKHTGYITTPIIASKKKTNTASIVVSIGGGRMGEELLQAVIESHQLLLEKWDHKLVLFSGAFQKEVPSINSVKIEINEFNQKTYLKALETASLIICMGGYNSLLEAVSTQKPVLVYKRSFLGGNQEQDLRATFFEKSGYIKIITPENLDKENLTNLIFDTVSNHNPPQNSLNFEGVTNSVKIISEIL